MVLNGRNGKGRKAESESINDRPKRSMIGPRLKNTEDLARQLRKCTGYMLPPFVYPAISSTKLMASRLFQNYVFFSAIQARKSVSPKSRKMGGKAHSMFDIEHRMGLMLPFDVRYRTSNGPDAAIRCSISNIEWAFPPIFVILAIPTCVPVSQKRRHNFETNGLP